MKQEFNRNPLAPAMSQGVRNKAISPTCRALTEANLGRLPARCVFREGEATYEAIQEVFWACLAEVFGRLLDGRDFPPEVPVGREQVAVPVSPGAWGRLEAELGIDRPEARQAAARVLGAHLLGRPRDGLGQPLASQLPPRLLGLVLLTCHLHQVVAAGPPRDYSYGFRELTLLARGPLAWVPVGDFDEAKVVRQLCKYAAMRPQASDRLLRIPYHAFYRPLRARRGAEAKSDQPETPGEELPGDFLLKALPAAPEPGMRTQEPETRDQDRPEEVNALLRELSHLRTENDRLRQLDAGPALASVLWPLLAGAEDPARALESARCPSPAQDVLDAVSRLCRSPEVEFVGQPGEVLRLELPDPAHRLDESVPPAGRDISSGRFRLLRRGVRLRGRLLLPATVVPVNPGG